MLANCTVPAFSVIGKILCGTLSHGIIRITSQECILETVSLEHIIWSGTPQVLVMNQNSLGPLQTWLTPVLRLLWCGKWFSWLKVILINYSNSIYWWFWKLEETQKVRFNVTMLSYTDEINFHKKAKAHLDEFLPQQAQQGPTACQHLPGLWLEHGTHSWHPPWGFAPGRRRYKSNKHSVSLKQKSSSSATMIYSWPLNNMNLNYTGPLRQIFFQ